MHVQIDMVIPSGNDLQVFYKCPHCCSGDKQIGITFPFGEARDWFVKNALSGQAMRLPCQECRNTIILDAGPGLRRMLALSGSQFMDHRASAHERTVSRRRAARLIGMGSAIVFGVFLLFSAIGASSWYRKDAPLQHLKYPLMISVAASGLAAVCLGIGYLFAIRPQVRKIAVLTASTWTWMAAAVVSAMVRIPDAHYHSRRYGDSVLHGWMVHGALYFGLLSVGWFLGRSLWRTWFAPPVKVSTKSAVALWLLFCLFGNAAFIIVPWGTTLSGGQLIYANAWWGAVALILLVGIGDASRNLFSA